MPDPKKPPGGEVNRRRSFFSSTLVIQPPPSSAFVNVPPSHTVLAALSSPGRTKVKHTIKIISSKPPAAQAEQTQTASSTTSGKKSTDKAERKVPSPQSGTIEKSTGKLSTIQQESEPAQTPSASPSSGTKSIKDKGKEQVPSPQSSIVTDSTSRESPIQPRSKSASPSASPSSSGTKRSKDKGKEKKVPSPQSSTTKEPTSTVVSTIQETSKPDQPPTSSRVKKGKSKGKDKKAPSSQTTSKQDAIGKSDPSVQTDRAAKARATRLVKLANARAEREAAAANPRETTPVPEEPRRTLRAMSTSTRPSYAPPPHGRKVKPDDEDRADSSPPHIILREPKHQVEAEKVTTPLKSYMDSGIYCQDDHAKSPYKLISRVLLRREAEEKAKSRQKIHPDIQVQIINRPTFPPLPYDHGYKLFFKEVKEFLLPFDIRQEAEKGLLDGNRKPAHYDKLEANTFPERELMKADVQAICRCDPESDCGDNCINRIMRYLCGETCPCGERCTNKSLATRKGANVKVAYTGSRGFGLTAVEDIKEDDFVIDYRGEIIGMDTYQERCENEYAISKNFYALAYDQDEVIDAGVQGNEARFINHSCNPNMVVHRYQNLGDGQEEFEVGMWALRDIAAGEELTYDYNFDAFGIAEGGARVECRCGAPNCVGFLGRKTGEKSAKQIALDIAAKEASKAKVARIKAKRPFARPETSGSKEKIGSVEGSDKAVSRKGKEKELDPREIAKAQNNLIHQLPTPESMNSGSFEIPPPVDFYKSPSSSTTADKEKKKSRQSLPNLSRPIGAVSHFRARSPQASSSRLVDSPPPHQEEAGGSAQLTEKVRTYVRRPYGVEAPKPISGWAIWLKKQAGKFPRTEESWQELKHARRKGEDWMNNLIAEYGRLPSRGVSGQVGSVVTQRLLDEKRRELEVQGIDYTARGPRGGTILPSNTEPVKRPRKRKRASEPARKKSSAQTDIGSAEDSNGEDEAEIRRVAKREAIKKRNGAPMGWVYEPITGPPVDAVDAVPEDLPPRRKRAMTSYAE